LLKRRASRIQILLAVIVIFVPDTSAWTQEAKKPKEKWVPSVEVTDKARKWLLKEAKTGTRRPGNEPPPFLTHARPTP
jgi:hypothetical protein